MTCIAAIVEGGKVYMAGDSAAARSYELTVRKDPKVFINGPMVIGYTWSYRMGQLLQYTLKVPEHPEGMSGQQYMVTLFIDAVREALTKGGFRKKEMEREEGGEFLVGYRGKIYIIHADFQVAEPDDSYAAVGCGRDIAVGALYGLLASGRYHTPDQRLNHALQASERFSAGVRGPFVFEEEPSPNVDPLPGHHVGCPWNEVEQGKKVFECCPDRSRWRERNPHV